MPFSKLSSLAGRSSGFNPNQPRVPAGHPDGGQWTSMGTLLGASADDEETLFSSSSTEPVELDEDFALRILPDIDERPKLAQARSDANANLIPGPSILNPIILDVATRRYQALSEQAKDGQQAIFTFNAREYRQGDTKKIDIAGVRLLERTELEKLCTRNKTIQFLTNQATLQARKEFIAEGRHFDPRAFGTRVHLRLHQTIQMPENAAKGLESELRGSEAEFEELKAQLEGMESEVTVGPEGHPSLLTGKDAPYGTRGSTRLDVAYKQTETRVCANDIKTGKTGLDAARAAEIAVSVARRHPEATEIIVTETRPFE